MKISVKEKRNGEPRALDAIFFAPDGSGEVWYVRTVDPETGRDPVDHAPEDLAWLIDLGSEDAKQWKLLDKEEYDSLR